MTDMVNYNFLNQNTLTAMGKKKKKKLNFISPFNNAHRKNKLIQAKETKAFMKANYKVIKATIKNIKKGAILFNISQKVSFQKNFFVKKSRIFAAKYILQ